MLAETLHRNRKPKTKTAVIALQYKKKEKSPQEPERLQPCAILPGSLEGFRVLPAKGDQPVIEGHGNGREGQLYLDLICVCCCAVAGCNAKRKQDQKLTSFAAWEVVRSETGEPLEMLGVCRMKNER